MNTSIDARASRRMLWLLTCTCGWLLAMSTSLAAEPSIRVLVRTAKPYDRIAADIQARGGRVTRRYQNFDGIAAEASLSAVGSLRTLAGTNNVSKDELVWLANTKNPMRPVEGAVHSMNPSPAPSASAPGVARPACRPTNCA